MARGRNASSGKDKSPKPTDLGIAARLEQLQRSRSLSEFARNCGIGESTMRSYMSGVDPTAERLKQIAKASDVTVEWLVTGEGPKERSALSRLGLARDAAFRFVMSRSTVPAHKCRELMDEAFNGQLELEDLEARYGSEFAHPGGSGIAGDFVMVPRYDLSASAGHGAVIASEQIVDYLAFKSEWVRNSLGVSQKDLALISVKGDSMEPTLSDGDLVLISTAAHAIEDSGVYVIRLSETLMVKRVQLHLDGSLTVASDNSRYAPEHVGHKSAGDLTVVGRVVWVGGRL